MECALRPAAVTVVAHSTATRAAGRDFSGT